MYVEFEDGAKFRKSEDNDISESLDTFKDAGYILDENDLVVDIDTLDKESIKRIIDMFDINTEYRWTERGIHFYFKRPTGFRWRQNVCALGFPIEYKHKDNTYAITVKRNGIERKGNNKGVREDLPFIFQYKRGFEDLQGLQDGEGRNEALYKHKMKLGYVDGYRSILKFINWNVFSEPLEPKEFDEVARVEVIPQGGKNEEYEVASYLIDKLDFIKYGGQYYFLDGITGEYVNDEDELISIVYRMCGNQKTNYIDEVIKQMKYRSRKISADTVFKIKLKNGYLENGKFYPIDYKGFTPYHINIEYKENAEPVKIVDDYINKLTGGDKDYKDLLLEALGHTLIVDPEFKRLIAKFFIFVGSGGNGKGTLLQIIKNILGEKNCTGMSISELSDERYLNRFKGKLANLGDDLQDQAINDKDMKVIKNITTCDFMSTRELYKNAEQMQFTGTLIFTSNHLIKSFEKGKSYKRRVVWLPMYTEIKEEDKDPLFITKLTTKESLEYWIRLIIEGYMRLYKNNRLTQSDVVDEFNSKYHEENNPALLYIKNFSENDFIDIPISDGYKDYEEWCNDNAENYNKNMLKSVLEEKWKIGTDGTKWINGKTTRVFRKLD